MSSALRCVPVAVLCASLAACDGVGTSGAASSSSGAIGSSSGAASSSGASSGAGPSSGSSSSGSSSSGSSSGGGSSGGSSGAAGGSSGGSSGAASSSGGTNSSSGSCPGGSSSGTTLSIRAGGAAVGGFVDDQGYSGGSTHSTTHDIDTSLVACDPPPAAVFQAERYGDFTYTIPDRTPSSAQTVTLYFAESYFTAAGQRTFDVAINGTTALSAFDIFAAAGGADRGIARTFATTADANGQVVIRFTGTGPDHPKVNGIRVAGPARRTFIDYFQPTPIVGALTSNAWGAPNVLPRDQSNGLEDRTLKDWASWDGKILRAKDGKYHLFGSRWGQGGGHGAWFGSQAIHAVSESSPLGPYVDEGLAYADSDGRGHNVTAAELPDGKYCILVSETRPASVYLSDSLDGPWKNQGTIAIDGNGFSTDGTQSNVSMTVRPDGGILMVSRHGIIMLSTSGIMGPYKVQGPSVYPDIPDRNFGNAEDPVIWYSGGKYHILYNYWDAKVAYHLVSSDGIHDWVNMGVAYDPRKPIIRYTDGTVERWTKLERPGVLVEGGHVTHVTFAAIDVEKDQDRGNDDHGSKIVVVPFDGAGLDADVGGTR